MTKLIVGSLQCIWGSRGVICKMLAKALHCMFVRHADMNNGEVKPTANRLSPEGRNKCEVIFLVKKQEQNTWRRLGEYFHFHLTLYCLFIDGTVVYVSGLPALYAMESLREGRKTHEQHSCTFKQSNF